MWVTQQGKIINGTAIEQITAFSKIRIITRMHNSFVSINGFSAGRKERRTKIRIITRMHNSFVSINGFSDQARRKKKPWSY